MKASKTIKALVLATAAFVAFSASAKAAKGSCIKKAIALKGSQTATLVAEYDPEEKETYEEGVAYYSITLQRGMSYTIWIEGGNAEDMGFDVDINDEEYDKAKYEKETKDGEDKYPIPGASFDIVPIEGANIQVAYLYADDWEADDPAKGKYIVTLSGDIGQSTTLNYTTGIRNFTVIGTEESPRVLSFANKWKSFSGNLIDGEYNFSASLKAGIKYRIRTTGGKKNAELSLDVDDGLGNEENENEETEKDSAERPDPTFQSDKYNEALVVIPSDSGKYTFTVGGNVAQEGEKAQGFTFHYTAVPTRAIGSHPYIPLTAEHGYSATFVPGRMANTQAYYDNIIDEHLCRIYLKKGERWVFETLGANKEQEMIAYNSKGQILSRNVSAGKPENRYDSRVIITASATGLYYVGVYDPVLDVADKPAATDAAVTLSARNTATLLPPDQFDPVDDLYTGATPMTAWPLLSTNDAWDVGLRAIETNVLAATEAGAVSGVHRLGANDIYDMFALSCRAGSTYSLRATFADTNDVTDLTLAATAFYHLDGTAKTATFGGTVSPVTASNVESNFTFKAKTSGTYYIRVWVKEGKGLDFPGYNMNAVVIHGAGRPMGRLRTDIEGGVGSWYINKETNNTYTSGATVTMPTNVSATVNFSSVGGFIAPGPQPVTVTAWTPGTDPVTVTGRYTDKYDAKYAISNITKTVKKNGKPTTTKTPVYTAADGDATTKWAFPITPAATAKTAKRTLWADDPADNFTFTASAGTYYNFTAASSSSNITLVVSNAETGVTWSGKPLADGTGSEVLAQLLDKGKTFVTIAHGEGEDKDAVYTLSYSKATPGVVRFTDSAGKAKATPSFTVKEGSEYATLYLARTGTEGITRVRYATQAGTAQPGEQYYPVNPSDPTQTSTVTWKAGDKAVKTIKIRLIPDMKAHWASSNLTFSVKIFPMDETDLVDAFGLPKGEYLARTNALDTATVTIVESTAMKPGKISLTAYGDGDSSTAVANVAKPVVTGIAGSDSGTNKLVLTFARTGGADGTVSVKVATSALKTDTAKAGVDYIKKSQKLTWEDGVTTNQTVTIDLLSVPGFTVSKKFNLAITAVKGTAKGTATPTLAASSATVTVKNAAVDQSAAAFIKTLGSFGLALKTSGTWYKDYDGTLRSAAAGSITYTLTGPGFFECKPSLYVPPAPPPDEGGGGCADESECEGDIAPPPAPALICQIDKEAPIDCAAEGFGGTIARVLTAGTHTVKFTVQNATEGTYASFVKLPDGNPYLWTQLSGIAPYEPMNKSVVFTNLSSIAWTLPETLVGRIGFWNRVMFGSTTTNMSAIGYVQATEASTFDLPVDIVLVPGKKYYWAVDSTYTDAEAPTEEDLAALTYATGAKWSFDVLAARAPVTAFSVSSTDAAGVSAADRIEAGEPIELIQGVKPTLAIADDGNTENKEANYFRFVGGKLPPGLSVKENGTLTGVPSTPGEYRALLQAANDVVKPVTKIVKGKKTTVDVHTYTYGSTMPVVFKVLPAGTAIGSFRAMLEEDGGSFDRDPRRYGFLSFSASSAGKLTASVKIGGVAYSFSGTGYELEARDEALPGLTRRLTAKLSNTTLINKTTKSKSTLTVTLGDGALTNGIALAESMGTVELEMNVANVAKTSVKKGVAYTGTLYRNNGATELGKAAMADFAGYYTVSLPPTNVPPDTYGAGGEGLPLGNGYLLMTVDAATTVKITGVLADGTAISCSTVGQLTGDDITDARKCVLNVPFYAAKTTTYSAAGVIRIAYEDENGLPVSLPSAQVAWAKPKGAATSRVGSERGFDIVCAPTGGWYDKTSNLQKYYINRDFTLTTVEKSDDLPAEALASGYKFAAATGTVPQGLLPVPTVSREESSYAAPDLEVKFNGNAFSVPTRKLVKNSTTGLYDFTSSKNPWAVTLKFTRATGVLTGTLSAWEWKLRTAGGFISPTAQKEIKNLTHKGVLLFSRDSSSDSPLEQSVLTSGFFILPPANTKTTKWKASLPIMINMTDDDERTWEEYDFPQADDPENDGGE